MTDKDNRKGAAEQAKSDGAASPDKPDWADGLKRLYDSVVEEPLPDSLMDLLSKLDDAGT